MYFLGLYWQWTRGSALVGWVKQDAEYIAQQIESHERQESMPQSPSTTAAKWDTSSDESESPAGHG